MGRIFPLVDVGLSYLPKTEGALAPPPSPVPTALLRVTRIKFLMFFAVLVEAKQFPVDKYVQRSD